MATILGTSFFDEHLTVSVSGTVDLPSYITLGSVDDFDLLLLEGEGSADAASKVVDADGKASIDVTVVAGPCKFKVIFNTTKVMDNLPREV